MDRSSVDFTTIKEGTYFRVEGEPEIWFCSVYVRGRGLMAGTGLMGVRLTGETPGSTIIKDTGGIVKVIPLTDEETARITEFFASFGSA